MATKHAVVLTGLILAALGADVGAQAPTLDLFTVPDGATYVVTHEIVANTISINGTLVRDTPGDIVLRAHEIRLGNASLIRAPDAQSVVSAMAAAAIALPGENGGSIILIADEIVAQAGATLVTGVGGDGGNARGTTSAIAGNGGQGGSLVVQADSVVGNLLAQIGAGGDGGHAVVSGRDAIDAFAQGGQGGASGQVSANADDLVDLVVGVAKRVRPIDPCGVTDSVAVCSGIPDDVVGDFTQLPARNGMPGLFTVTCSNAQGEPGPVGVASGGRGGDACVHAEGHDGSPGDPGSSGWINCRDGGRGGDGGNVGGASATAGNGGTGLYMGGDGGHAEAVAEGGDGGQGGQGGTRMIGTNCRGGDGGAAGSAGSTAATAGSGGSGVCRAGGQAGSSQASSVAGGAGSGGPGNPSGVAGPSGATGSSTSNPGLPGEGPLVPSSVRCP